jgi:hypothetical protein
MAEQVTKDDGAFQELLVGNEPRVSLKDSTIRVISPKPKMPLVSQAPISGGPISSTLPQPSAAPSPSPAPNVSPAPIPPVASIPPAHSTISASSAHPNRDWAAAVELVNEAAEAVRLADERAIAAERYSRELADYYGEQIKTAEARIAVLESRLKTSDGKVREAEEWLVRFHDAIVAGFGNLPTRPG